VYRGANAFYPTFFSDYSSSFFLHAIAIANINITAATTVTAIIVKDVEDIVGPVHSS